MRAGTIGSMLAEDGDVPDDGEIAARPLIVVVDDDTIMRKSLQTLLRDRYRVIACASAKEGVIAVDDEVCVVILDVRMKGYDGFWACDEIRKKHPDIPVVFYSAYHDLKDPLRIINEHRPFGYIMKDGDAGKLLETVEIAVRLYKMTLDNRKLVESLKQRSGS